MTDTGDSETAQPKQLRDIAAERLRAMIAQGKLRGGDWLRQAALSAELGISYTPIREALKQLEAEGLVEHVPYRGVRVVQFRPEDILDIYAIRLVLEAQAAASAAQRITDAELEALRQLHDRMCQLHGVESLAEVRALNERFHLKIVEASGFGRGFLRCCGVNSCPMVIRLSAKRKTTLNTRRFWQRCRRATLKRQSAPSVIILSARAKP
jgi:DNA-binding GntR family transcriptional regulator